MKNYPLVLLNITYGQMTIVQREAITTYLFIGLCLYICPHIYLSSVCSWDMLVQGLESDDLNFRALSGKLLGHIEKSPT